MNYIDEKKSEDILTVFLKGHIDSSNSQAVEDEIRVAREENPAKELTLDCENLDYISSAGLRIILRLKKEVADLSIVNVSSEVYEVFDMTGFTEMMHIEKAYRKISVEGCEVIGQGSNGKVYRIDPDTIVKVYKNPDSLDDIKRERELARTALILGIPTAIPYDVVKVEGSYGSVFELLNATSFAALINEDPKNLDSVVTMSVDLLKKIHGTVVDQGSMPPMKETAMKWATYLKDYLPKEQYDKLYRLFDEVPEDNHMLHGDYHVKNVMLQNGEVLLIDMDTLCVGHPIFEFAAMFNAYEGYSAADHSVTKNFLGIEHEQAVEIWQKSLRLYFEDRSDEEIAEIEKKAQLIGFARILRRAIKREGIDNPEARPLIDICFAKIAELLPQVDTLTY